MYHIDNDDGYYCIGCDCKRMNPMECEDDRPWETLKGSGRDVKMIKLICPECGCISYRCIYRATPEGGQGELFDGKENATEGIDSAD